jgi:hypothetical protein
MPTTGQKDAQGYIWNGGQWVSQDGYAKGSAEDQKSKRNWFQKAGSFVYDVNKDTISDLMKAKTWANPGGENASGFLGLVNTANTMFNPVQSLGQANVVRQEKGLWDWDVAKNLGGAAIKTAQLASGANALQAARVAGNTGVKMFPAAAKSWWQQSGTAKPGGVLNYFGLGNTAKKVIVRGVAGLSGLGYASALNTGFQGDKPTASSVLPGPSTTRDMSMTAEEMQRRAAMERNRTDAAGNSGMGGRNTVYTDGVRPPGGYPGAPGAPNAPGAAVPAPLDLAPLTPEQLNETGQDLVELEQVYQDALNQYGLAEKRGQQGYVQEVQGARRQAAGSAQDLANQLASAGLDISPAAAFGAGQMTNAPRMARETSARKTLDQLLAEITTGRTQARTQRDRNQLMTNNQINAYRNQNSFDAQQAAYERMAGN